MKQNPNRSEWEEAYDGLKRRQGKRNKKAGKVGNGYVRLELIHPNEAQIKKIKHTKSTRESLLMLPGDTAYSGEGEH
ncbi:MAG TPA: hypothetical protein VIS54_01545 [Psychromonas sp.]